MLAEVPFGLVLDESKCQADIRFLAGNTWLVPRQPVLVGRSVADELEPAQCRLLTRSFIPESPPAAVEELTAFALSLRDRVDLPASTRYRLVGVGLSGFRERGEGDGQGSLFEDRERQV